MDNVTYNLSRGDFLLVQSETLHRAEPNNCIYECMFFDLNMLRKNQNDISNKYILPILNRTVRVNCFFRNDNSLLTRDIISLFIVLREQNKGYEMQVYSLFYHLISELYLTENAIYTPKNTSIGRQNQIMIKVLDWIDENYTEPITLKELSSVSGLTEKYFCRFFKDYTAQTPISYINSLRIEKACYEIEKGGHCITEAAFLSGFNDMSYFSKMFKRLKCITPREYRKQIVNKKCS